MTDNELLDSFFQPARQQQIADNGFTERVMDSLPEWQQSRSMTRLSQLWTTFCVLFAAVLFFRFVGWQSLFVDLFVFVRTVPVNYDFTTLLLSLMVISWFGIGAVAHRARLYL